MKTYAKMARRFGEEAAEYFEQELRVEREAAYLQGCQDALTLVWDDVKGKKYQTPVRRLVGFLKRSFKREAELESTAEEGNPWSGHR